MQPWIPLDIAGLLTFLAVGSAVVAQHPRRPLNRSFAGMSLAFSLVAAGSLVRSSSPTLAAARLGTFVLQLGLALVPIVVLHFSMLCASLKGAGLALVRAVDAATCCVMSAAAAVDYAAGTGWVVHMTRTPEGYGPIRHGPVGVAYAVVFTLSLVYTVVRASRRHRAAAGLQRIQLQIYLAGFVVFLVGGILAVSFISAPIALLTLIAWYLAMAYAITRYQFLDVQIVVRLGVVYALATGILLAAYAGAVVACTVVFGRLVPTDGLAFPLVGILAVALGFNPLRARVQSLVDRAFFRRQLDIRGALEAFASKTTQVTRVTDLRTVLAETFAPTLHPSRLLLFVRDEPSQPSEAAGYRCAPAVGRDGDAAPLGSSDPLVDWCAKARRPLAREELLWTLEARTASPAEETLERRLLGRLDALGADLVVPLVRRADLVAILLLGPKRSETPYRRGEIAFVSAVAAQTAVILQNLQLHEAARGMEKKLHEADKLAVIGALSSQIAHEFRGPLSVIRTYIRLVPEKYADADFRERLMQCVDPEVARMERILYTFLRGASGRPAKAEAVRISDVAEATLDFFTEDLSRRRIAVARDWNGRIPTLTGDPDQLRQVFQNLVMNAMQAMPGGGRLDVRIRASADTLRVEVADTGLGFPPDQMEHLFRPFATTKAAGTGLGLAITRRIVEDHHGMVRVENRPNGGATFVLEFPLRPPAGEPETTPA